MNSSLLSRRYIRNCHAITCRQSFFYITELLSSLRPSRFYKLERTFRRISYKLMTLVCVQDVVD